MAMARKIKPAMWVATAVVLLAGLSGLVLHHHEDGQSAHDCAVCRFVQYLFSALILVAGLIASLAASRFFAFPSKVFTPILIGAPLGARAPPVLS